MIIAVTVCSLSRAAAEKVTGEETVAPLAGEQIFTVLSTVLVHAADAPVAHERERSRRDAAENPRNEITQGPLWNKIVSAITEWQWAGFQKLWLAQLRRDKGPNVHGR